MSAHPCRCANRLKKMKKIDWVIYFIFVLLVALSFFCGETKTHWVNNAILAFTAVIVLWYTRETSEMKQEVAKQNLLLTRPILILELNNPKVFLKNEGRGPALNGVVEKFLNELETTLCPMENRPPRIRT